VLETGRARLLADGRHAARGEVERLDPQAAAREVQTIAALAGAELQQVMGAGRQEGFRRRPGRRARRAAEAVGAARQDLRPVCALPAEPVVSSSAQRRAQELVGRRATGSTSSVMFTFT
jgi:hypothetical protein